MVFLYAFIGSGLVCLLGQIIYDHSKWTPGHITSLFVVLGAFLDTFGWYDRFIEICDMGAMIVIPSFGHSLIHGALANAHEAGLLGILLGVFDLTAAGISSGVIFAFFVALLCKVKV